MTTDNPHSFRYPLGTLVQWHGHIHVTAWRIVQRNYWESVACPANQEKTCCAESYAVLPADDESHPMITRSWADVEELTPLPQET